ncbi:MAG: LytTR family DNA-binding domain-containing protein [Bacteroidia bacterium]
MKKYSCLVIDDEPLACKGLCEYISEVEALEIKAVLNHPSEAIAHLNGTDLLYLDVNMPKISGIDFLKQISNPPLTILTTAYPQYALEGFELDVVDYLLKPISFPRFLKATTKAIDFLNQRKGDASINSEYFFVKSNGVLEKIVINEIDAVEALSNYIIIHTDGRKIVAYLTLKQILSTLPASSFIQVHKSFVVAMERIQKIDREEIVVRDKKIPVGSNFKEELNRRLIDGKLLKR